MVETFRTILHGLRIQDFFDIFVIDGRALRAGTLYAEGEGEGLLEEGVRVHPITGESPDGRPFAGRSHRER